MKQSKKNLQILQGQNELQEEPIMELIHYLNLTVLQVGERQAALYDLDTRLCNS